MSNALHSAEVIRAYGRILETAPVEERGVTIGDGHIIHFIEAGDGPPLVYFHGSGAAAHTALPMMAYLEGLHFIAPDRPGCGLSDFVEVGPEGYRAMALEVTDQILDALDLDPVFLAGSSGGGLWAIWYALAHPERVRGLLLLGSAPLLPGTHAPLPLRLLATPVIGGILARLPSDEEDIVQMMTMVGEGETIVNYPLMISALAAANDDPLAMKANRIELSAVLNLFGFKERMKIRSSDLAQLRMPTLVVWGTDDPIGDEAAARAVCQAIPNCELAMLPAGHVPWLGHPDEVAELVMNFAGAGQDGAA